MKAASMQTEICITIDTEFSIGGAFQDPTRRSPIGPARVLCEADGRENGLGFLLDTFGEHGIAATFFVEALQGAYFGDAPMGGIIERILAAGQDVQLHLHPCWRYFHDPDWRNSLARMAPNDDCDGRTAAEMQDIIAEGIASLRRMGAPPPVALRTGNLRADSAVYAAMAACGLRVASNIGAAVFLPREPELQLLGGRHWIGGVLEVPVLTYVQLPRWTGRPDRLLTITATSWQETESLLWRARKQSVETIVLLTHPFEFIKHSPGNPDDTHSNRINQRRLERLCGFIATHPGDFTSRSFVQAAPRWLAAGAMDQPRLQAPLGAVLSRMCENKINDTFMAI
jgi:hypothetical protein